MNKVIRVFLMLLIYFMLISIAQVAKSQPQSNDNTIFENQYVRFWLVPYISYGETVLWENKTSYNVLLLAYVGGVGWTQRNVTPYYCGNFIFAELARGKLVTFTLYKLNTPNSPSNRPKELLCTGQFVIPAL